MMAASMWRMNGLCRRMAAVLVLCALLLSNEVMCQVSDATTSSPKPSTAPTTAPGKSVIPISQQPTTSGSTPGATSHAVSNTPQFADVTSPPIGSQKTEATKATDKTSSTQQGAGVTKKTPPSSSSSGSSVFVGILVTGLLAALAILIGHFKCQRRTDTTKGVRLAEEAYPVDQENQGDTLVSEAPLNPPAETQEKPNVNGESLEAAKTQPPPPNNGHSTAKTADTEL